MPRYIIERSIAGAGKLTPGDLRGIAQKSCDVLKTMGPGIQWVQSYVTGDKVFCEYIAANEKLIRDHATKGEFPVDRISEVKAMMDPTTSEAR